MASELSFELVPQGDGVILYVEDHGKPVPTAGMSGKLLVTNGLEKTDVDLKAAGENRLQARGVKVETGTHLIVVLTSARRPTTTVRFWVK